MPAKITVLLASLALVLSGCASLGDLPTPLARSLPATCQKLLKLPPLPDVKPTDDARVAFMREDAALISDRAHVAAFAACDADLRRGYAVKPRGGKP